MRKLFSLFRSRVSVSGHNKKQYNGLPTDTPVSVVSVADTQKTDSPVNFIRAFR